MREQGQRLEENIDDYVLRVLTQLSTVLFNIQIFQYVAVVENPAVNTAAQYRIYLEVHVGIFFGEACRKLVDRAAVISRGETTTTEEMSCFHQQIWRLRKNKNSLLRNFCNK